MTGTRDRAGREPGPVTRRRTAAAGHRAGHELGPVTRRLSAAVTEATAEDRAAVTALWHACGLTRPWNDPDSDFRKAIDGALSTIFVHRNGGDITGSVMAGFDGHRGWVHYLAVAQAARRRGTGRALMAAAEGWLAARGAAKIQLMVRDDNAAAAAFYAALGFDRQAVATYGRFIEGTAQ